jgi:hypothetical protein
MANLVLPAAGGADLELLAGGPCSRLQAGATVVIMLLVMAAAPRPLRAQAVGPSPDARPQATWELRGRVVDSISGEALPGAIVRLPELRRYTLTNTAGYFHFRDVPAGSHDIAIVQLGYNDAQRRLPAGDAGLHVIAVAPRPIRLDVVAAEVRAPERLLDRAAAARAASISSARGPAVFWRAWDRRQIAASGIDEPLRFLNRGPPRLAIRRCVGLGLPADRLCVGIPFGGLAAAGYGTGGAPSTLARVYVDDRLLAAIEELRRFRMDDFHRVETFGYRGEAGIRLYTEGYLRLVAAGLVEPETWVPPGEVYDGAGRR